MSNGKPVKIGINNEICPYCGHRDKMANRIRGLELIEFQGYYGDKPFRAFKCYACSARWHHSLKSSIKDIAESQDTEY